MKAPRRRKARVTRCSGRNRRPAEWRLADLHEIATGHNVTVAVIDSMVERNHPDLIGQIILAENFVSDHPASAESHGTGVAGVIAALADTASALWAWRRAPGSWR